VRRKVCRFCAEKVDEVDYKAIHILRGFITARGKLLSGRTTGNCARHQRQLSTAVKRAQNIALLPFTGE
jgi:small subunit ribosomal protein S18